MTTDASTSLFEQQAQLGPSSRASWFPCIDGLRAIAALAVFTYHSGSALLTPQPRWMPEWLVEWIARLGTLGVAIFFVISGFLLYRPFVIAHLEGKSAALDRFGFAALPEYTPLIGLR